MHHNDAQMEPLDLSTRSGQISKGKQDEVPEIHPISRNIDSLRPLCSAPVNRLLYNIEAKQCEKLLNFQFKSVKHIYNPVEYAHEPHTNFLNAYCKSSKRVLFLGMNPGPYGMCQTGVPFGDVSSVINWLKISGQVNKPINENPKKEILGFKIRRSEVSGSRFWTFIKDLFGSPDKFFENCFVHNYCPLAFLSDTGKNITPPELKPEERQFLIKTCDDSFVEVITLLQVRMLVAIGNYAFQRAKAVLSPDSNVKIIKIMHPSPINPAANKGWKEIAYNQLLSQGFFENINYDH